MLVHLRQASESSLSSRQAVWFDFFVLAASIKAQQRLLL